MTQQQAKLAEAKRLEDELAKLKAAGSAPLAEPRVTWAVCLELLGIPQSEARNQVFADVRHKSATKQNKLRKDRWKKLHKRKPVEFASERKRLTGLPSSELVVIAAKAKAQIVALP